jgi:hypothetical protein
MNQYVAKEQGLFFSGSMTDYYRKIVFPAQAGILMRLHYDSQSSWE